MTGVVVNPASGHGRAGREWPSIEAALRRAFGELAIRVTATRGDGTRLARELLECGAEPIIAVGGDGTCNEVANAGCGVLGVLAWARRATSRAAWARRGTGATASSGCAVRARPPLTWAAPATQPGAALAKAAGSSTWPASDLAAGWCATWGSPICWRRFRNWAAVQELGGACARINLVLDGEHHAGQFLHVAVGNGRYQGNGMRVCPRAELDDGRLEITAIEPVGLLELALNLRKIYSGALLAHPKVRAWRARSIRAASDEPVALELDGDPAGYLPVDFRVLPEALRVLK